MDVGWHKARDVKKPVMNIKRLWLKIIIMDCLNKNQILDEQGIKKGYQVQRWKIWNILKIREYLGFCKSPEFWMNGNEKNNNTFV